MSTEHAAEKGALVEALAGSLYESLMEASADQWRRWRYLTDAAKESYRAEAARIVTKALTPAMAAQALRDAAEDPESGPGAYIGHPDHWNAQQARDRMWRDALERRAIRIEDEQATPPAQTSDAKETR